VARVVAQDQVAGLAASFAATPRHDLAGTARNLRRLIDQLEAVWLDSLLDLEESGVRQESGAASLAAWLRREARLAPGEARRAVSLAQGLDGPLVATAEALSKGQIRLRHAQVIAEAVALVPQAQRETVESVLVPPAKQVDPIALRRLGQHAVYAADPQAADAAALARYERRGISIAETFGGMVAINGVLDPLGGASVLTAIESVAGPARRRLGEARDARQLRADALAGICQGFVDAGGPGGVGGAEGVDDAPKLLSRTNVSVIVDVATLRDQPGHQLGQLDWAGPITANQARMLACDANVSRILTDGPSQILDVGRTTRTIPAGLRRAVIARDRGCIASGCTTPTWWCEVHHIRFWEHGGATSLDNLALVCRHHHHDIHLGGATIITTPDGAKRLRPPLRPPRMRVKPEWRRAPRGQPARN